ncbi:MAG: cysteine hydrolase family protein [Gemmatimonadaceae bacterium]
MPDETRNDHGNSPDHCRASLVLVDVINDMQFDGATSLLRHAIPMARRLKALKRRAREAGIPVIYVNDNFGRWQSDWEKVVAYCLGEGMPGRPIVKMLKPDRRDYFILKPKHSGFYSTNLDVLLRHLGVETIILTGIAGNICVFFTASDAHMRDFRVIVPSDCVASKTVKENKHALEQMESIFEADVSPSAHLNLADLRDS